MKRFVVLAFFVGAASVAHANVEIGGTAGLHAFSDSDKLGAVGMNPTGQNNSALFAGRLGFYFSDALGVEAEAGVIPSETPDPVIDVYNLAVRASVVFQFHNTANNDFVPFVMAGGGMLRIVSTGNSDIVKEDTRFEGHVGVGVKYKAANGWGVRVDVRALLVPKQGSGVTPNYEGLLSLYREFGRKEKKIEAPPPPKEGTETDPDHDGIVGAADKCPNEAEDKDGFEDDDGCPDPDNDKDGIADAADKCPMQAEDKDGFQDDDGCPDPDNDGDGVPDAADKCPDKPETLNGFEDGDGCPDELPANVQSIVGPAAGVTFKGTTADLAASSNAALDKIAAAMTDVKDIKVEIAAHTDDTAPPKGSKFADNAALSQARADAIKAYLVKKGVDESRIVAKGYGDTAPIEDPKDLKGAKQTAARAKNRRIEVKLVVADAPAAAPAAAPAPAPAPAPAS